MNVYDHIAANNRRSTMILLAFPVALFVVIYLFSLLLIQTGFLTLAEMGISPAVGNVRGALEATLLVFPWVFLVAFIWIAFSYFSGGSMILGMAHAREVTMDENRDLYRLVENTAIMAGLPTPKIYIIKSESLNAFATGRKPETASIAVTEGLVDKLSKAELQAVIAHELAHVGNRDTRLMLLTIAGIGCFTFFGEVLLRSALRGGRRSSRDSGKATLIILLIAIACLIFGYLVAPIIRFALSRRREYQADATAAKITRDPDALARALEKISGNSKVADVEANPLVGNIWIANPAENKGLVAFESKLYSTHPPIEARVTALRNMMGKIEDPTPSTGRAVW